MYFNIWLHYRQEEREDLKDYDSASTRYIHSIESYSSKLTFKALTLISSFRLINLFINSRWTNYPTHKHHIKLDQLKFYLILLKERTNGNGKNRKTILYRYVPSHKNFSSSEAIRVATMGANGFNKRTLKRWPEIPAGKKRGSVIRNSIVFVRPRFFSRMEQACNDEWSSCVELLSLWERVLVP